MFQEMKSGENGGSNSWNEGPVELSGIWEIARGIQHGKHQIVPVSQILEIKKKTKHSGGGNLFPITKISSSNHITSSPATSNILNL